MPWSTPVTFSFTNGIVGDLEGHHHFGNVLRQPVVYSFTGATSDFDWSSHLLQGPLRDVAALRADADEIRTDFLVSVLKTMADTNPAAVLRAVADVIESNPDINIHPRVRSVIEAIFDRVETKPIAERREDLSRYLGTDEE